MLNNIKSIINQNKQNNQNNERINWDEYFMSIALLASCRSPCCRLHVGSVIINDNRIISMGYNGFFSGVQHISHIRDGHEQATIHSEINAITDCAKRGVSTNNSTIYITHYPCINCFKAIASCGIKKIIYLDDYKNDELIPNMATELGIIIQKLN
jgi:dCMP deaminase